MSFLKFKVSDVTLGHLDNFVRPARRIPRYNLTMPHSYEEVRQFAQELPEDQQILLANSLWESVVAGEQEASDAEIAAALDAEIAHRVGEIRAGTAVTYSPQEVKADLRAIVGP